VAARTSAKAERVRDVSTEVNGGASSLKLISGGQSGVDRAALDVALSLGLPAGGWCPSGRRSEDGLIPEHYPLQETRSAEFHVRTQRNVETSSATLVLTRGTPTGGTRFAIEFCRTLRRPVLVVDLFDRAQDPAEKIVRFLAEVEPRVLNVCGPRESFAPGIGAEAQRVLSRALTTAGYA
jgi:hypothetical protein